MTELDAVRRALEAAAKAGAEAYAELLRGVQNKYGRISAEQTGTNTQAYDHIIRRMQDLHGSYQAQIAKAADAAIRALRPEDFVNDQRGEAAQAKAGFVEPESALVNEQEMTGGRADSLSANDADYAQSSPHQSPAEHWVYDAAEACRPFIGRAALSQEVREDGSSLGCEHLQQMLVKLRKREFSVTKACRWLGWIQAALVAHGVATLEEMKAINKSASDASDVQQPARAEGPIFPNGNTAHAEGLSAADQWRLAKPAETLRVLAARLSEQLSPAEKREIAEAATYLEYLEREVEALRIGIKQDTEELDRLRKERNSALDLLAVIHRDGGHYTEAVGFINSCADAIKARTKLVLEIDRLRAENERLKDDIRQMVEKAADRSLAGYRELGNKAAAAELRAERAEAKLASGVVVPEHPSVAILLAMSPWFSGDTHAIKREEVYKAMLAAAKEGKE